MNKKTILALWAVLAVVTGGVHANITFSGGGGTPLTVSFDSSLTFTGTNMASVTPDFLLVIRDAYNSAPSSQSVAFSGGAGVPTISYSTDSKTIQDVRSRIAGGDMAATDLIINFNTLTITPTNGGAITIGTGTATTTATWGQLPNKLGTKNVYLVDFGGGTKRTDILQTIISVIPEPSTYAMIGAGVLGLLATRRRRA